MDGDAHSSHFFLFFPRASWFSRRPRGRKKKKTFRPLLRDNWESRYAVTFFCLREKRGHALFTCKPFFTLQIVTSCKGSKKCLLPPPKIVVRLSPWKLLPREGKTPNARRLCLTRCRFMEQEELAKREKEPVRERERWGSWNKNLAPIS